MLFTLACCVISCATDNRATAKNGIVRPGLPWPDSDGVHINAHGFCIVPHEGKYFWYGAHKIAGKTEEEKNEAGVRCYVSTDLVNWTNAGLVLDVEQLVVIAATAVLCAVLFALFRYTRIGVAMQEEFERGRIAAGGEPLEHLRIGNAIARGSGGLQQPKEEPARHEVLASE